MSDCITCAPALFDIVTEADKKRFLEEEGAELLLKKAEMVEQFEAWLLDRVTAEKNKKEQSGVDASLVAAKDPPPPPSDDFLGDYLDGFKDLLGNYETLTKDDVDSIVKSAKLKLSSPVIGSLPKFDRILKIESLLQQLGPKISRLSKDESIGLLLPVEDTLESIQNDLKRICQNRYENNYIECDFTKINIDDFKIKRRLPTRIFAIAFK